FFTRVVQPPGKTTYQFKAVDIFGNSATTQVTIEGLTKTRGPVDFNTLSDVSTIGTEYGVTSWNKRKDTLYAELAVKNTGTYPIATPLVIGITDISNPTVIPVDIDGYTPDGIPYYNFSRFVADGMLSPGEVSQRGVLAFLNPSQKPFTYKLVLLGQLNRPPVFTSAPEVSVMTGTNYSYPFSAVDLDSDPITYTLLSGPSGMTMGAGNTLVWNPTASDTGSHAIMLEARDPFGARARQSFQLTAYAPVPNRPPVIVSVPTVTAYVDSDYSYDVTAEDPDQDVVNWSLVSAPAITGMAIAANGPRSARVTWRPTAAQVGLRQVTILGDDSRTGGTVTQSFNIQVLPAIGNGSPAIVSDPVTKALSGQPYTYPVIAVDPDNDTLTYRFASGIQPPGGMQISSTTGLVTWAPPQNTSGFYPVEIEVDDGRGWVAKQAYTLELINTAPATLTGRVFFDNNGDGLFNGPDTAQSGWTVFLDANDNQRLDAGERSTTSDASGNYTFPNVAPGPYIVAEILKSDWAQTAPANAVHRGTALGGQQVSGLDFGNSTRTSNNRNPSFMSSPIRRAVVGQRYRYETLAVDPDGDRLTYKLAFGPRGMSIEPATGTLTWTPAADENFYVDVTLRVEDGYGGLAIQPFQIFLDSGTGNRSPEIISTPQGPVSRNKLWNYDVDATDADGDVLSYAIDSPSITRGMTINSATGLIAWTPTLAGSYRTQVTVADGRGGVTTQTFTVDVGAGSPPRITSVPPVPAIVGELYEYPIIASDADGDTITLALDAASIARGMAITNGKLVWTATSAGDFPVTLTARDSTGLSSTQSFDLPARPKVVSSLPPEITSKPIGPVYVGTPWSYVIVATDPDSTPAQLVYSLQSPTGDASVTFNPLTRTVGWLSSAAGQSKTIRVRVTDQAGSFAEQTFTMVSIPARTGAAPRITSVPTGPAVLGQEYLYEVKAFDPNGDAIVFSLGQAVSGASIDAVSGKLVFNPTTTGSVNFVIHASDTIDGTAIHSFTLNIVAPPTQPPEIVSAPVGPAVFGTPWTYKVIANDPERQPITVSLNYSGSETVTINNGIVTWNPSAANTSITATVTANDGNGGTA
ncbi:MAG: putative Ig domain-containing protein, partial [Planctomycetota bacterium]